MQAPAPTATGIDYLALIARRDEAELARAINYSQLSLPDELAPREVPVGDDDGGEEVAG